MDVLTMYNDFRKSFPKLTECADKEHVRLCWEVDPEFAYTWFQSLANVINYEMNKSVQSSEYKPVFDFILNRFNSGSEDEQSCIDVSFVENLFWKVPPEKAKPYWDILPEALKELYVDFHHSEPA